MNVAPHPVSSVVVNGIRVELIECGAGKPLLFLHPGIGLRSAEPLLDALGRPRDPRHRRYLGAHAR